MSDPTFRIADDGMGRSAVIGEVDTPVGVAAAWVPVSREAIEDSNAFRVVIEDLMAGRMRRLTHPWEFPDGNPFPKIDPVPWYTTRIERYRELRQRIRDAREVLRYGLPEGDW